MKPKVINWYQIEPILSKIDVIEPMKQGFIDYSKGLAEIPPVGELIMEDPPGDVHIKYGYLKGGKHYVIKIASGFIGNNELGIKPGQGMMLLFDIKTGQPLSILIDEANLTDIRTGIAGAITSSELASKNVDEVLIVGTGVQARYQTKYICQEMGISKVVLWGRDESKINKLSNDIKSDNINVEIEKNLESAVRSSKLIITTTSARSPLVNSEWVQPGTHITAVGSDTHDKCELDYNILAKADLVVADSIEQNVLRGEIHQALKHNAINEADLIEIGCIFENPQRGRKNDEDITVADLTGVAVQDLVIAEAVYNTFDELND
tara:strand:- start:494 stop:1456 length:963 start_codon:yes stop_codon:yes gene_type:complete